jgi:hypothetical protein
MSSLTLVEKRKLEKLFGMSTGYVLDFSNRTFAEFVVDSTGRDIDDAKYDYASGSKANRLRAFWTQEPDHVVGQLLNDLLEHCQLIPVDMRQGQDPEYSRLFEECHRIAQRLLQSSPVDALEARSQTLDRQPALPCGRKRGGGSEFGLGPLVWHLDVAEDVKGVCELLGGSGSIAVGQRHFAEGVSEPRHGLCCAERSRGL